MFMPTYLSIVLERMWRILRMHPDFGELPPGSQLQIMHTNCLKGMSLVSVRGEHSNGFQQFQNSFGELDEQRWKEHYMKLFSNLDDLKSHSVSRSPALTPEQRKEYARLISEAKVLMCDPTLFKLNLLLTMTQPTGLPPDSPFSKLHFKYATLLRRRLWWMHMTSSDQNLSKFGDPDEIHFRIRSSIQSLDKISKFLAIVLETAQCVVPNYLRQET